MNYQEAEKNMVFKCLAGSHSYGTNTEHSDVDTRGIFIAPPYYLVGMDNVEEVHKAGNDETLFEIRKYVKLASECNPNILELLFIDDRHILFKNKYYDYLRNNRNLFLSTKVEYTYGCYARAQFNRIKTHRNYLLNPPSHKPTRKEFGLEEYSKIPKDHRRAFLSIPDEFLPEAVKNEITNEKRFESKLAEWNSYKEWEKTRNVKRQELEAKFGFDTKHASHLVRLFIQGKEILTQGTLTVYLKDEDREFVKDVRAGKYSFEFIENYQNNLDAEFKAYAQSSKLPYSTDKVKIRNLLMEVLSEAYGFDLNKKEINLEKLDLFQKDSKILIEKDK
jgi:predicted nucleotidyltransferase